MNLRELMAFFDWIDDYVERVGRIIIRSSIAIAVPCLLFMLCLKLWRML